MERGIRGLVTIKIQVSRQIIKILSQPKHQIIIKILKIGGKSVYKILYKICRQLIDQGPFIIKMTIFLEYFHRSMKFLAHADYKIK